LLPEARRLPGALVSMQALAVLGSTGSIGRQALAVAASHPERLRVTALTAGQDVETLAAQAARWSPRWLGLERAVEPVATRARLQAAVPAAEVRVGPGTAAAIPGDAGADVVVH